MRGFGDNARAHRAIELARSDILAEYGQGNYCRDLDEDPDKVAEFFSREIMTLMGGVGSMGRSDSPERHALIR